MEFQNIFPDVYNKNLINNNDNIYKQNNTDRQHEINPFKDHSFLTNELLCPLSCEFDYHSITENGIPIVSLPDLPKSFSFSNDSNIIIIIMKVHLDHRSYSIPNDLILFNETYSTNNRNNDININDNANGDNGNPNLITNRINISFSPVHNNVNLNNNNNHNDTNGNVNINFNINNILIDRQRRHRRARMDLYNPRIDKN